MALPPLSSATALPQPSTATTSITTTTQGQKPKFTFGVTLPERKFIGGSLHPVLKDTAQPPFSLPEDSSIHGPANSLYSAIFAGDLSGVISALAMIETLTSDQKNMILNPTGGIKNRSPLVYVIQSKNCDNEKRIAMLEALRTAGADINHQGANYGTFFAHSPPLHEALSTKLPEVAKYLLDHGASIAPTSTALWSNVSALHIAAEKTARLVSLILDYNPDINTRRIFGPLSLSSRSALEIVVENMLGMAVDDQMASIGFLLQSGADEASIQSALLIMEQKLQSPQAPSWYETIKFRLEEGLATLQEAQTEQPQQA